MNRCFFIPPELLKKNSQGSNSFSKLNASLVYALLFEGEVIISDSTFVNTYDLRMAPGHEPIRQMILNKKIIFATRTEENMFIPLENTANQILARRAMNPSFENEAEFKDYSVFSFVEKNGHRIPYSPESSKTYYSQKLLATFQHNDFARYIPGHIQQKIIDIIQQKIDEDGHLMAAFFEREHGIGDHLKKVTGDNDAWKKYGSFIFDASIANYYSYMPDLLAANPIYGKELDRAFDIWRNTVSFETEDIAELSVSNSLLRPLNFIYGIMSLNFDDLMHLLNSDEYHAYQSATLNLKNTTASVDEVKKTFEVYKRRIDWMILERFGVINKEQHQVRIRVQKKRNTSKANEKIAGHILFSFLDAFTFNITSAIKTVAESVNEINKIDPVIEDAIQNEDDLQSLMNRLPVDESQDHSILRSQTHLKSLFSDTMISHENY